MSLLGLNSLVHHPQVLSSTQDSSLHRHMEFPAWIAMLETGHCMNATSVILRASTRRKPLRNRGRLPIKRQRNGLCCPHLDSLNTLAIHHIHHMSIQHHRVFLLDRLALLLRLPLRLLVVALNGTRATIMASQFQDIMVDLQQPLRRRLLHTII